MALTAAQLSAFSGKNVSLITYLVSSAPASIYVPINAVSATSFLLMPGGKFTYGSTDISERIYDSTGALVSTATPAISNSTFISEKGGVYYSVVHNETSYIKEVNGVASVPISVAAYEAAFAASGLKTQAELDDAVTAGKVGLKTQAELDDAVTAGKVGLKTQTEVDDAVTAGKVGLKTQAQVDAAVATAVAPLHTEAELLASAQAVSDIATQHEADAVATVQAQKVIAETARDVAIADKNAGLAGVVSNLLGVDISAASGSVTFSKTKTDYTGFDADKKITGNALANKIITGVNSTNVSVGDGNDSVIAGAGSDSIDGGKGNDTIDGGDGNNKITSGSGDDIVTAGIGNDSIDGGVGNDSINGGDGSNSVSGGAGSDSITAGLGDDKIDGGDDNDLINSGDGDNKIIGGKGDDTITVGSGNDKIDAGDGNDGIYGGAGNDTIIGGSGDDAISTGAGADSIDAGAGNDRIETTGAGSKVLAGSGDDSISIYSSSGALPVGVLGYSLDGGAGNDFILLNRSFGSHKVAGGAGDDILLHDNRGIATLDGGAGNDYLYTEQFNDVLTGGAGSDTFDIFWTDGAVKITDFKSTVDKIFIDFSEDGDTSMASAIASTAFQSGKGLIAPTTADAHFVFNQTTGALFYDADGSASFEPTLQIALLGKVSFVAADILVS